MNERLVKCREQALARINEPKADPKAANWTRAFFELYADLPLAERQARSLAYALENEPVYVYPHERLAGQIYHLATGGGAQDSAVDIFGSALDQRWQEYAVYPMARKEVRKVLPENELYGKYFNDGAYSGHVSWDYGMLLKLGIQGMLARIAKIRLTKKNDVKAGEFYDCETIVLNGLLAWVKRHSHYLRQLEAGETDPQRRQELAEMRKICERVPEQPARTFREAVQCFWLQHLAVVFENQCPGHPGRLDWCLWPYLEKDLAAGRTTPDEARELIAELFIKLDERIHELDNWQEAIVVGGRNPDGTSAVNPLSYLMVEAIMDLKQTHPSVYIRLHDDAPEDFSDLAVRYIIKSGNRAQVFGDDAIIAALVADGTDPADARHWAAEGCMEIGVQGMSGDLLWAFTHNVARTFELVINGGKLLLTGEKIAPCDKELGDYAGFDELYDAFISELTRELSILLRRLDIYLKHYAIYRPAFLLSSMTHDCLERSRSLNDGGARYPHYGGSGVGIPNVGDSLHTIKKAVFEDKRYTGQEVLKALRSNFEGYEKMRAYLRHLPKYGSGDTEATRMTDKVLLAFCNILKQHRNPVGGHCRPVILGFMQVVSFGLQTGATPDGRLAGRPLAQSLSPQSGSAVNGILPAINDATSLSLQAVSGGASMMWDIDSFWAKPDFVKPMLLTYIEKGGHIFQGNTTAVEKLIEAQQHPAEHPDLMVRVGGFSARFNKLSRETQNEIIERHKYGG